MDLGVAAPTRRQLLSAIAAVGGTAALYQAMESSATAMVPNTTVIPFMSTGATDGAALRAKGIPTYGILPMPLPMVDELRMHGDNERVPVPALGWAAEFLYRTLQRVTAK